MISLTYHVDADELIRLLGRMKTNFPGFSEQCIRGIADRAVKGLKRETKARGHHNTGYLMRSFRRVKMGKSQYAVVAAGYLRPLEGGSAKHWIPIQYKSILWAARHGWNYRSFRNYISKHGTKPHPYTTETLLKMQGEFEKYLRKKYDKWLQSGAMYS